MHTAFIRRRRDRAALAACATLALLASAAFTGPARAAVAQAHPHTAGPAASTGAVITLTTTEVGSPGNPPVAIVPFTDAVYRSCAQAPRTLRGCQTVGAVRKPYEIGQLEITVQQWVAFLNTADPTGRDPHPLYNATESGTAWPKYGQIDFDSRARPGAHYTLAYPQWADKPYGFATFLRAARFVNALYNGRVLSKRPVTQGRFHYVTYQVELSTCTETGMYDLSTSAPVRTGTSGFVVPSQDEWIKAAYYDPNGGGTYSYWKYPTNPGVFGDGSATAPSPTTLNPGTGDVTNAATQPLASYRASGLPAPSWCPPQAGSEACAETNPFGLDPVSYAELYQGSLGTVGQARTTSPWGTLDQGGNAVEATDTITAPPSGRSDGRVWRRAHGGVSNAPAVQLWLSAVGLVPQDDGFFSLNYPWYGFRIGLIGSLDPAKSR